MNRNSPSTFATRVRRTFSVDHPLKHRRVSSDSDPLPNDPGELDKLLTKTLIRQDPASLLKAVQRDLKQVSTAGGRVLYKKGSTWPTQEDLWTARATEHQMKLYRWNAIHDAQHIARQFLMPRHECDAVTSAADDLLTLCDSNDIRRFGLASTPLLRQQLLVMNMAYVTACHEAAVQARLEQGLASHGSPRKKKDADRLPDDAIGGRSQSDMGRRSRRLSLQQKFQRIKLPLVSAPIDCTDASTPEEAVKPPEASEFVNVMRRPPGRGSDSVKPGDSSGRASPTKSRINVRFKSLEDFATSTGLNSLEPPLKPRDGSGSPPIRGYTRVGAAHATSQNGVLSTGAWPVGWTCRANRCRRGAARTRTTMTIELSRLA